MGTVYSQFSSYLSDLQSTFLTTMKLIFFAAVLALAYSDDTAPVNGTYTFKCVISKTNSTDCTSKGTGADQAKADAAAKAAAKCHGPDGTPDNKYTEYGCGACAQVNNTDVAGCKTCPSAAQDTGCNTYADPKITFQCYKAGNKTTCPAATKIECFWPSKTYKGNDAELTHGGCGSCAAAHTKTSKWNVTTDCVTCTKALCNSAHVVIPFLAPLIAVLFWL